MRRSRTASRSNSLVCPLCGSGELRPVGHNSALCASGSGSIQGWTLELLCQVAALPDAFGRHACECGHPEMRRPPTESSTALPVARKCSPSTLHEARIHGAATDLRAQHLSSPRTLPATPLRKEVWQ
jgi:hypothetical protein